jgi:hypothetical protein
MLYHNKLQDQRHVTQRRIYYNKVHELFQIPRNPFDKHKLSRCYKTDKGIEKLLKDKGNTFSSINTGRRTTERLSSRCKQRPSMASIW